MSQLGDIINQINNLTGFEIPSGSGYIISQSAQPLSSGSVNEIIDYLNSLTGYNIPYSNVQVVSGSTILSPVVLYVPYSNPSSGSAYFTSHSTEPVGSGSVNQIINLVNTLTGFEIPGTTVEYVSGSNRSNNRIIYLDYPGDGTIPTSGIAPGKIIYADHVLRIINALNGVNVDTIIISGSLLTSGSNVFRGTVSIPTIPDGQYLYTSGGVIIGTNSSTVSASYATYAATASYFTGSISNAISASYAFNSTSASRAISASYTLNATSASRATTSSYALNAASASYVVSASYAFNATSASRAISASYAFNATSASRAVSASIALTASYFSGSISNAIYATSASYADSASFATTASYVTSASYASTASYTDIAGNGFPYSGSAIITGSLLVSGSGIIVTGSINITQGAYNVNGVNVLDTALAYAIALG